MKQFLFLMLSCMATLTMHASDIVIASPQGQLVVTVSHTDGNISYTVSLDGQQMLAPSALGLKTDIGETRIYGISKQP